MYCTKCNTPNDPDARFCSECGTLIDQTPEAEQATPARTRKPYLYALLLLPVLIGAAAIGYYKFLLPEGIAAVVNGEEIRLAELDAAVNRTVGSPEAADSRLRYQILNSLITERLVLQEARKAGVSVSGEEVRQAIERARSVSGLEEAAFEQRAVSLYGSMQDFERSVRRSLLANKFIAEKVIPANADPRSGRAALDRWLQDRSAAASVRVTLAEQWSGAGCGCCGNKAEASTGPAGKGGCRTDRTAAGRDQGASNPGKAADAAMRYWQEKHGAESVTAKVTDFGCHMQVDIIKDDKVIGSLRYQGGAISE